MFDGGETDSIAYNADEAALVTALEEISTIYKVKVTFQGGVSQACQAYSVDPRFAVTFLEVANYRGDVPLMTFNLENLEVRIPLTCSLFLATSRSDSFNIRPCSVLVRASFFSSQLMT